MGYNLKQLRTATEAILRALDKSSPALKTNAINWADLHCVAALRCEDDQGGIEYRVEIQEVAPDAGDLQRYVSGKLEEVGFKSVMVYTEW